MSDFGQREFEREFDALKGDLAAAVAAANNDPYVRSLYQREIMALSEELRRSAVGGEITWREAASRAHEARNAMMEVMRGRTSPVGRALAESLKKEGLTLNELVAKKTIRIYGPTARFDALTAGERDAVFTGIVRSAASSNADVDLMMLRTARFGRGLLVLSVAIAVYDISTSKHPLQTAGEETAIAGGGILGGMAGGALAGLACGPGAPVCVTVGAFVGGALAGFGVSWLF